MITPLQREKVQRAARIAASAARVSLVPELEDWKRSANPILAQAAADELSRRRDVQKAYEK